MVILPTFYAWSKEHIRRVFEAKTPADCLQALNDTFSQDVELTLNGSPIPRTYLESAIMGMVEASEFRLSVEWLNAVEVPRDEFHRVCTPVLQSQQHINLTAMLVLEWRTWRVLRHPKPAQADARLNDYAI